MGGGGKVGQRTAQPLSAHYAASTATVKLHAHLGAGGGSWEDESLDTEVGVEWHRGGGCCPVRISRLRSSLTHFSSTGFGQQKTVTWLTD